MEISPTDKPGLLNLNKFAFKMNAQTGGYAMRSGRIERKTKETEIEVELTIEGRGAVSIDTGIGFFDHMLESFAKHGLFDLKIKARGDLHVDGHHTVEDTGISLGMAFKKALGDMKGIKRAGFFAFPMDEALTMVSCDISGRPYLYFEYEFKTPKIGDFETELVREFLYGFVREAGCTLHVDVIRGYSAHHIVESIFKGLGKALKEAVEIVPGLEEIPSTKGLI